MKIKFKISANGSDRTQDIPLANDSDALIGRFTDETIFHHATANMVVKVQGKLRTHFKLLEDGKESKLPKGAKEWDVFLTPKTPKTKAEIIAGLGLTVEDLEAEIKIMKKEGK